MTKSTPYHLNEGDLSSPLGVPVEEQLKSQKLLAQSEVLVWTAEGARGQKARREM